MKTHELKIWPDPFRAVIRGSMPWQFRKNDREFKSEDRVELLEYNPKAESFTGRAVQRRIGYILYGPQFGIPDGYCVFTLAPLHDSYKREPYAGSDTD